MAVATKKRTKMRTNKLIKNGTGDAWPLHLGIYLRGEVKPIRYVKIKKWPAEIKDLKEDWKISASKQSVIDIWNRILSRRVRLSNTYIGNLGPENQLLTKHDERYYFGLYNYAKMKINHLQTKYIQQKRNLSMAQIKSMEAYHRIFRELGDVLAASNMALVNSVMKTRFRDSPGEFDEMSDRLKIYLVRCIDGFNPDLGWKFSTYAYRSLLNGLSRKTSSEKNLKIYVYQTEEREGRRQDTGTLADNMAIDDTTNEEINRMAEVDSLKAAFHSEEVGLSDVEKFVLVTRYGLSDDMTPETFKSTRFIRGHDLSLEDVGKYLNLTKERIRQIQMNALEKLKDAMVTNN